MDEDKREEEKASMEAGGGALEGSCETPSGGAQGLRGGEGKKVDTWVKLPKAEGNFANVPRKELPTRECGESFLNWGLEARKDDNKR